MNAIAAAGELAGMLFQLIGVLTLTLAAYVFVETAIKAKPPLGWGLAATAIGIFAWPLVGSLFGAYSLQTGLGDSLFASAGKWTWIGCLSLTPLVLLICLAANLKRLWKTALGIVAGAVLIALGFLFPLLGQLLGEKM